jgi:hypothetical protein
MTIWSSRVATITEVPRSPRAGVDVVDSCEKVA